MASSRPTCGGCSGTLVLPKEIPRPMLGELVAQTRLKPAEVNALYARFRRLAPTGVLLCDQFKQALGVLGLTDDAFLPNRMFQVFDTNQDGQLDFSEFASSLAVMLRGTEDEKLTLSFDMIAGRRGASCISREDFQRLVSACGIMNASLVGSNGSPSTQDAHALFLELASPIGSKHEMAITLESYKAAAKNSDGFLKCIGLRPNAGIPRVLKASEEAKILARRPFVASDERPVLAAHMEDLRGRLVRLEKAVLEATDAKAASMPATAASGLFSWFLSMCVCSHATRDDELLVRSCEKSGLGTAALVDAGSEDSTVALDEVRAELDGIFEWCAQCEDAAMEAGVSGSCMLEDADASLTHPVATDGSLQLDSFSEVRPNPHVQHAGASDRRVRRYHKLLGPKKGLAVHFGHENWNMVISMMIGIRMSMCRSQQEIARELTPVDFAMKEKFSITPRLANILDSTVSSKVVLTRFIDYAPMVFSRIRSSFGIQAEDYVRSVGPEQLLGNMVLGNLSALSELSSEGKSGAFFYYTADGKYMLKTVSPKEFELLRAMLEGYYDHIVQNSGTLLVRFFGLHCLSLHEHRGSKSSRSTQRLYFVVMANMFNTPFEIHRRYDLKGSWIGRETPDTQTDRTVALKDRDFQRAGERILIGRERKEALMGQIERDVTFLRARGIIDYSMLIGIHEIDAGHKSGDELCGEAPQKETGVYPQLHALAVLSRSTSCDSAAASFPAASAAPLHQQHVGGMLSSDGRYLYFIGVIDILTPYDTSKVLEHHAKALLYGRHGVSCCHPQAYADRFTGFMRGVFH
mmetsp:Transcript_3657/g.9310  ORF Transcript_3657/g.9310 Transcript_3657/m.9310 type:complete len:805 (+) Transcript_3657:150-2564(+)